MVKENDFKDDEYELFFSTCAKLQGRLHVVEKILNEVADMLPGYECNDDMIVNYYKIRLKEASEILVETTKKAVDKDFAYMARLIDTIKEKELSA